MISALEQSKMLQLSPDKRKVKRVTPIVSEQERNADSRTVYIVCFYLFFN